MTQLEAAWPTSYWDHWLRYSKFMAGHDVIIPEVCFVWMRVCACLCVYVRVCMCDSVSVYLSVRLCFLC